MEKHDQKLQSRQQEQVEALSKDASRVSASSVRSDQRPQMLLGLHVRDQVAALGQLVDRPVVSQLTHALCILCKLK